MMQFVKLFLFCSLVTASVCLQAGLTRTAAEIASAAALADRAFFDNSVSAQQQSSTQTQSTLSLENSESLCPDSERDLEVPNPPLDVESMVQLAEHQAGQQVVGQDSLPPVEGDSFRVTPDGLGKKIWDNFGKPASYATFLALLGFVRGVANNYLSNGAVNRHFYKAPQHEWITGLANPLLAAFAVFMQGRYNFFPAQSTTKIPLMGLALSLGQALGEVIQLPGRSGRRNLAFNLGAPFFIAAWYALAGNGIDHE